MNSLKIIPAPDCIAKKTKRRVVISNGVSIIDLEMADANNTTRKEIVRALVNWEL